MGFGGIEMTDEIPEEMKDQMLALIDNFYKKEWQKFADNLDGLKKSTKEMLNKK